MTKTKAEPMLFNVFVECWNKEAERLHQMARDKGFYDGGDRDDAVSIALIHSEVSEAMDAHLYNRVDDKIPEFSGLFVEMADAMIRIMDTSHYRGWDIAGAIKKILAEKYPRMGSHSYHGEQDFTPVLGHLSELYRYSYDIVHPGMLSKPTKEDVMLFLGLTHLELSFALEAIRNGFPESSNYQGISLVEEHLANAVILMISLGSNIGSSCGSSLGRAIEAKALYNSQRAYKHGKEF